MQSSFPISVAVLLAACGVAATTSNDAAESGTQESRKNPPSGNVGFPNFDSGGMAGCFDPNLSGYARRAAERLGGVPCDGGAKPVGNAGDGASWVGEYRGNMDGGPGTVTIAAGRAPHSYAVSAEVVGPGGCSGTVSGTGSVTGNRMILIAQIPEDRQQCRITLDRNSSTLRVAEVEGCTYFHGMSCGFTGSVTRRGQAAVRTASGSATPWIVGAWAYQGGYCASGEPIIFEADGGYGNSGGDIDGRWSLSGDVLTVRFAQVDPETGRPTGAQRRAAAPLARINANEMRFGRDRYRRCPTRDGVEPWHPTVPFERD